MLGLITNEVTGELGLITDEVTGELGLITNEVTGELGAVDPPASSPYWKWIVALSGVVGAVALAYHGYERTGKTYAAVGWGILGAIFPANLVAAGIAASQGFAKPQKKGSSS